MTDQDLFHAQQRIAALERKVTKLYELIDKEEPQFGPSDAIQAADTDQEIMTLVQEGKEIQAIKRYRELTGLGLAEATDAIRALNRAHGPISDPRY